MLLHFVTFQTVSINQPLVFTVSTDQAFLQFFGDEFLRLLLIRFVFCSAALRLHKLFRVSHCCCLFPKEVTMFILMLKICCIINCDISTGSQVWGPEHLTRTIRYITPLKNSNSQYTLPTLLITLEKMCSEVLLVLQPAVGLLTTIASWPERLILLSCLICTFLCSTKTETLKQMNFFFYSFGVCFLPCL